MKLSAILIAGGLAILPAAAQMHNNTPTLKCNERERNSRDGQVSHCEIREQNTGFGGRLTIDAGVNGGVSVKGWDQGGVLVRAQVQTWGTDEGAAQATASQVRIDSS